MKELSFIIGIHIPNIEVFCNVIKDGQSCIPVTESYRFSLRTKHIDIKYHQFQIFVQNNILRICYYNTQKQTAYIFTKSLGKKIYLQRKLSRF